MTTYNAAAVSDTAIAFEKPITLQQGRALRDNLLAALEGDSTAPKIARPITAQSGTTITFTGAGPFSGAIADVALLTATAGTTVLSVSFSDDGTTFYGSTTIYNASAVTTSHLWKFWVNFATGAYTLARISPVISGGITTGTVSGISLNVTHIRFTVTGSSATTTVVLELNGGIV